MRKIGSKRMEGLIQSDIRAMTIACKKLSGINLGQGLCELDTPKEIIETAQRALAESKKSIYSQPEGIYPLRKLISEKLKRENNIDADPETDIVITHGATGGFMSTLMSLFDPGDGILVFEPYYGYHVNSAILAEVEPQFVKMNDRQQSLDEQKIRHAIKENTKAMILCTPGNPGGKMYSEGELKILGKIAVEFDLLVITDEMYEFFRYDGIRHISPASVDEFKGRTITMMGLSKTFSITGWRLGYLVAAAELAEKIRLANDLLYVCPSTPLQHGVKAGFEIDSSYFSDLASTFEKKRDVLCQALEEANMPPIIPQGAYYVLADISRFGFKSSYDFAMNLLETAGVASVPGRAFFTSPQGEQYVRFNFAVSEDKLTEACRRLHRYAEKSLG